MTARELHPKAVHEESRVAFKEYVEKDFTCFVSHFYKPVGNLLDVEISSRMVDGERGIIQEACRDITQGKQSEKGKGPATLLYIPAVEPPFKSEK